RNHCDRSCLDAALDGGQMIPAQPESASELARILLHREQRADRHWQRKLFPERRWLLDACQEGPAAPGFEIFQANAAVTRGRRSATPHAETAMPWDDSGNGAGRPSTPRDVLGHRLEICSINPMTAISACPGTCG